MTKTLLAAVLVAFSATASFAAVNPGAPLETAQHIYDRCGVALTNPNAIVASSEASCSSVKVQAMLAPVEQPADQQ